MRVAGTLGILASPACCQLVRVIGDGPQHGGRTPETGPSPRRPGGRDEQTGTRHPVCPGCRPSRDRRGGRLRRGRHAERGRHGRRHNGHRPRSAARRVHQRVRPHPGDAERLAEGGRPIDRRARPGRHLPHRARQVQRQVLHVPHRCRVRRGGGAARRGTRGTEALRGSPVVRGGVPAHVGARLRPQETALRSDVRRRQHGRKHRRRVLHHRHEHEPVHVPRQPSARPGAGNGSRCRSLGGHVQVDERRAHPAFARLRPARWGRA